MMKTIRSLGAGIGLAAGLVLSYDGGAAVVYVNATTGNDGNDGLSWERALATIDAAVGAAAPDDEIWIAKGTYAAPSSAKGIALYAGFDGTETSTDERHWENIVITTPAPVATYDRAAKNRAGIRKSDRLMRVLNDNFPGPVPKEQAWRDWRASRLEWTYVQDPAFREMVQDVGGTYAGAMAAGFQEESYALVAFDGTPRQAHGRYRGCMNKSLHGFRTAADCPFVGAFRCGQCSAR